MKDNNNNENNIRREIEESNVEFTDVGAVERLFAEMNGEVPNNEQPAGEIETVSNVEIVALDERPAELVAHVLCQVEENEMGGLDMVYKADNIENNVTGIVVLDMFRGYVMASVQRSAMCDALATPMDAMLQVQDKVLEAYQTVKGSTENRFPMNLEEGVRRPYLETVKPKDECYEGMAVSGRFEDVGTMVSVLMARYIEQTHIQRGQEVPETFMLINPTGDQTGTLLNMANRRNDQIRAGQWQTVFSRLRDE
ncbi:hypothetical protein [Bacillus thuringiensis]|uniref:hypothetical protein n=1 Tax=Bacillus thuringiensis TaxID=1428 RepID=UPI000BFB761A|nr:hypothetical protein [Bacillus thuringiensis]PGT90138.1 hypothetical protein COD17_10345 [Bacillus thuringiensis]